MNTPIVRPVLEKNEELYELVEDFHQPFSQGDIYVPKGFEFDGASIPSPAWQLTYTPFNPIVLPASLIHDWIYYNHQLSRSDCDDLFYEMLKSSGASRFKRSSMWTAVRAFGGEYWENDSNDIAEMQQLYNTHIKNRDDRDKFILPEEIIR
jgi:hypothetical protein